MTSGAVRLSFVRSQRFRFCLLQQLLSALASLICFLLQHLIPNLHAHLQLVVQHLRGEYLRAHAVVLEAHLLHEATRQHRRIVAVLHTSAREGQQTTTMRQQRRMSGTGCRTARQERDWESGQHTSSPTARCRFVARARVRSTDSMTLFGTCSCTSRPIRSIETKLAMKPSLRGHTETSGRQQAEMPGTATVSNGRRTGVA